MIKKYSVPWLLATVPASRKPKLNSTKLLIHITNVMFVVIIIASTRTESYLVRFGVMSRENLRRKYCYETPRHCDSCWIIHACSVRHRVSFMTNLIRSTLKQSDSQFYRQRWNGNSPLTSNLHWPFSCRAELKKGASAPSRVNYEEFRLCILYPQLK